MASFRKRNDKWQARITRQGHPDLAKSFNTRQDAEKWARATELAIDQGTFIDRSEANKTTLAEVIQRYMREVLPSMKGAKEDAIRLNAICRRSICKTAMSRLTASAFALYRDERLQDVSTGTVIRELAYLSSIINHGRREWGIHASNPVAKMIRSPTPSVVRRLRTGWLLSRKYRRDALVQIPQPVGTSDHWGVNVALVPHIKNRLYGAVSFQLKYRVW